MGRHRIALLARKTGGTGWSAITPTVRVVASDKAIIVAIKSVKTNFIGLIVSFKTNLPGVTKYVCLPVVATVEDDATSSRVIRHRVEMVARWEQCHCEAPRSSEFHPTPKCHRGVRRHSRRTRLFVPVQDRRLLRDHLSPMEIIPAGITSVHCTPSHSQVSGIAAIFVVATEQDNAITRGVVGHCVTTSPRG